MSCKCALIGDHVPGKVKPKRICHCRQPIRLNDDDPVKEGPSCCCSQICSLTDSRQGCQEHGRRSGVSSSSSLEDGDGRGECLCTSVCQLDVGRGCTDNATSTQGGSGKRQSIGSDRQTCGCLDSSAPIPKLSCFSMDSSDLQYIEHVKNLVTEDSRLKKELDDLTQKEDLMKKTMVLWKQMSPSEAKGPTNADMLRELNPEIIQLRSVNKELGDINESLTDALEDLHLEREQVEQKITGPLTRELDRLRRKDIQLSADLEKTQMLVDSITREGEVAALRQQVKRTKANIEDLSMVNDGIKNEVIVINYRCSQMEALLLEQKKGEIAAINKMSAFDDGCSCDEDSLLQI